MNRRFGTLVALLLVGAAVGGCEDSLAEKASSTCFSDLTGTTSPTTGALTLQGHFFSNESILVRDASTNALVASGTPSTDRDVFTFTGLPSGSHSYTIIASCSAGQETLGTEVVTVK